MSSRRRTPSNGPRPGASRGHGSSDGAYLARKTWARVFEHRCREAADAIDGLRAHGRSWLSADGDYEVEDEHQNRFRKLSRTSPLAYEWLRAIAGPDPDPDAAHEACVEVINHPAAAYALFGEAFPLLQDLGDPALQRAASACFVGALLDSGHTKEGTRRPWFENDDRGLLLRATPFDLKTPVEDLSEFWRNGLEPLDLFDIGRRRGPDDFPVPVGTVWSAFEGTKLDGTEAHAEARVEALLSEALDAKRWVIPWGARVELQVGPFVAVRLFESPIEVNCHFLDKRDRYFHLAVKLRRGALSVMCPLMMTGPTADKEPTFNRPAELTLRMIVAAIVRDFLVVEDRDAVFRTRPYHKRHTGIPDARSVVYLPRFQYARPHPDRMNVDEEHITRARHKVTAHLRRAENASGLQRFLASAAGFELPVGFTFVREHWSGTGAEAERIKTYRSTSAAQIIFDELTLPKDNQHAAWFEFEKACEVLASTRGLTVINREVMPRTRSAMRLFAADKAGQTWVMQCHHCPQYEELGADSVSKHAEAILRVDRDGPGGSKGVLMCTGRFSEGAILAASEAGIDLVDYTVFGALKAW